MSHTWNTVDLGKSSIIRVLIHSVVISSMGKPTASNFRTTAGMVHCKIWRSSEISAYMLYELVGWWARWRTGWWSGWLTVWWTGWHHTTHYTARTAHCTSPDSAVRKERWQDFGAHGEE